MQIIQAAVNVLDINNFFFHISQIKIFMCD